MADQNKDVNGNDFDEFEDLGSVTLTLDDGSEKDYEILAIFPAGDQQYIALWPEGSDDLEETILYRYIDNGDDVDPDIENIENDDEYELALDAFDELLDETDFEDL